MMMMMVIIMITQVLEACSGRGAYVSTGDIAIIIIIIIIIIDLELDFDVAFLGTSVCPLLLSKDK
jgi:hypothetical protein